MATLHATFVFALPEDSDSNFIRLFDSDSETGTYAQVGVDIAYEYGTTTYEFEDLDEDKWYKLQFYYDTDDQLGPLSDPVFGGDFSAKSAPFLAISTRTDGSFYASTQDVYDYSNLLTSDVSSSRVSQALNRARAIIDLRTAEMGLDRFTHQFDTDTSRKKYNAHLRVVRESEICMALSMIYRGMADDKLMKDIREDDDSIRNISVGATSISNDRGALGSRMYINLTSLSIKYATIGTALLHMLMPNSVMMTYRDVGAQPWFPFGWKAL